LLGAFAVLFIMTSAGQPSAWAAGQSSTVGGTTIGPVQISALGHPSLCWEAGGNGSGVTLEHCDHLLQGQQWSLTPNGVLMNGNGYCLEAVPGRPLFIDFADQCAGAPSQLWHYHSGHLTSPVTASSTTGSSTTGSSATGSSATRSSTTGSSTTGPATPAGVCAVVAAPLVPGAEIAGGSCPQRPSAPRTVSRWSIGYSAVTVTPGRGRGPAGGTFSASVTLANAPSAQAAYGVSVAFTLPPGVSASTLHATPGSTSPHSGPPASGAGGSALRCDVGKLTCTGTVPAGATRRITLTGPVPAAIRPGDTYPLHVRASVTGTTQRNPHTARTAASLTVTVTPAAPKPRSPLPLIAGATAVLLLAGSLLILITHRTRTRTHPRTNTPSRPRPPSRHRVPASPQPPPDTRVPASPQPPASTQAPADTYVLADNRTQPIPVYRPGPVPPGVPGF
jgi:hypothetical protein